MHGLMAQAAPHPQRDPDWRVLGIEQRVFVCVLPLDDDNEREREARLAYNIMYIIFLVLVLGLINIERRALPILRLIRPNRRLALGTGNGPPSLPHRYAYAYAERQR